MSNNPFESPSPSSNEVGATIDQPAKAPVWLIVIAVLCILLAVSGLGFTCIGTLGLVMNLAIETVVEDPDAQQKLIEAQKPYMPITLVMMVLGAILFIALLVGGIGTFKQGNTWAYTALKYSLFAGAMFYVANGVANYYVQSQTLDATIEMVNEQQQGAQKLDIKPIMQIVLVFALLYAIGVAIFMVVSGVYLSKSQQVKDFLNVRH